MTGLRWASRDMPLLPPSDGAATPEMPALAARLVSAVDTPENMVRVLLVLALTFASVSVLSTLAALYWFVKMKRSFRHEYVLLSPPPARRPLTADRLILLLIQSDFLKSMAFVVFAIVSFVWGNVPSDSVFCQVSGFALAIGIESSDIAVLLIALHSAMYILRPRSGLYPYRRIAYLFFYLYPALAACLAFIDGNGYENMGHYCYLRNDRSWARLALSWVPRYVICVSIVVIYVFIYLYIRKRMGDYGRRRSEAMQPHLERGSSIRAPLSPRLCSHGLIPSAASSRRSSATDTITAAKTGHWPTPSLTLANFGRGGGRSRAESPPPSETIKWDWPGFTQAQQSSQASRPPTADEACDPISHTLLPSPPPPAHTTSQSLTIANRPASEEEHQPPPPPPPPPPVHHLFIYPLVYILTWLFPFISHIRTSTTPIRLCSLSTDH